MSQLPRREQGEEKRPTPDRAGKVPVAWRAKGPVWVTRDQWEQGAAQILRLLALVVRAIARGARPAPEKPTPDRAGMVRVAWRAKGHVWVTRDQWEQGTAQNLRLLALVIAAIAGKVGPAPTTPTTATPEWKAKVALAGSLAPEGLSTTTPEEAAGLAFEAVLDPEEKTAPGARPAPEEIPALGANSAPGTSSTSVPATSEGSRREVLPRPRPSSRRGCWVCGKLDHHVAECPQDRDRKRFCYLCGRQNVTAKTCPTCGPYWRSLGPRRHQE